MEFIRDGQKSIVNIGTNTKNMNCIYFALHTTEIGI